MTSTSHDSSSAPVDSMNFIQRKSKYNALSQVPAGAIVEEGISDYIDYKIEDLGSLVIHSQLSLFYGKDKKIKPEFSILEKKKLHNAVYFLEEFSDDHIRIILRRVHDDKMYLVWTHDITPKAIHVVINFCNTGKVPALRKVSKTIMSKLTGSVSDSCGMTINSIKDDLVKYACMVIGYWTFSTSRINSIFVAAVNATYRMIKEDASFDLCTCMQRQLLLNLNSIKQDNAMRFKFRQLLVGLFFYFQGYFPRIGDIQWFADQPVTKQINEILQAVGTGHLEALNK